MKIEKIKLILSNIIDLDALGITYDKLVLFFIVLILIFALRYILSYKILPFISKLAAKSKNKHDDEILKIIEPPLRLFISITGIFLIFRIFLTSGEISFFVKKLYKTFIIFELCWILYRSETIYNKGLKTLFEKKKLETALGLLPVFNRFIKISIIVLGFLIIFQEWGFHIGALITGLGIGGVAVALAAKDTVSNFFGSVMILFDTPFKIGDWIQTSDMEGVVEDIGFRSTKVRTFAQALVTIPNSKLANEVITNWSKMGKRRITYKLNLKYSTPVSKIKKFVTKVRDMLNNHPEIDKKTIFVFFDEFSDSYLNIFLYFFTKTTNWKKYLEVREDVNFKIIEIAEEEGVEFAFPATSIYLEKNFTN